MFDPSVGSLSAACMPGSTHAGGLITPSVRSSRSLSVSPVDGNERVCLGASTSGFRNVEAGACSCPGATRTVATTTPTTRLEEDVLAREAWGGRTIIAADTARYPTSGNEVD
jgi:hypothetical protein